MADKIDEDLYSRQLYVLGHDAMHKMQQSNVLIVGLDGLGIEIAKNLILAGIKSLSILDNTIVQIKDLSSQFYLTENHVGKLSRSDASISSLKELNRYVTVHQIKEEFTPELIKNNDFQVIVSVNQPLSVSVIANKVCRSTNSKFITADSKGLYGQVFVDNGPEFVVTDDDGEPPAAGIVTHISNDKIGLVTCSEENRHGLSSGSTVMFSEVEGMSEINNTRHEVKVTGPYTFTIGDTSEFGVYTEGGLFNQIKTPTTHNFLPLDESLKKPEFLNTDFNKMERPLQLHALHIALNEFHDRIGRLPKPDSESESQEIVSTAVNILKQKYDTTLDNKETLQVLRNLARSSSAVISPMASIIGGFAAQEALKSVSGKFTPIKQHLYFDADECFPSDSQAKDFAPIGSRYDDTVAVFGKTFLPKLNSLRLFLVGSGAIGCELLKNWAMMGVACGKEGECGINVTDMDSIEKSNLNRQFLFRDRDVSKLKSKVAGEAVTKMNPKIRVYSQSNRVAKESENIYNDTFWEGLDIVCTALDNVETRLYVDGQCVLYKKPLFESGTLGTKGNTQTVIPFKTESYGSTRDPPEKSIPICTLKNFPNKIEHTIQWGRDLFEWWFKQAPEDANSFLTKPDFEEDLKKNSSSVNETVENVCSLIGNEKPKTFDDCLRWARCAFEKLFIVKIEELLYAFPLDHVTTSGNKFWSGPKRAPKPLSFDINDPSHLSFITSVAHLRASLFLLPIPTITQVDKALIAKALESAELPRFDPRKKIKIATTDEEEEQQREELESESFVDEVLERLPASKKHSVLQVIEFEKDNNDNFHMAFVTACANLRARNYAIKEVSLHECKLIAGKIIPAIATSTALVSGLVCLEIYKFLLDKPVDQFKNAFVNLAISFITFCEPNEPKKTKTKIRGKETEFSLWDEIFIDEGDITLRDFLDYFTNKLKLKLEIVSCNPSIIYAEFMAGSKTEEQMRQSMSKLVQDITGKSFRDDEKYIILEASACDLEENEVEIPTIKFQFRK